MQMCFLKSNPVLGLNRRYVLCNPTESRVRFVQTSIPAPPFQVVSTYKPFKGDSLNVILT